ncbi:hypothetical protein J2Z48_000048 [Croceifilum oryzae]|uniref:Uncharacterized protein n=1 Tax=Croceifilum oryzae TaxID=1553429 RepID=A0AAJ1TJW5_9BACL|nr:hypothetical protein [Croceifilum oryzae]MDQ0415890.1 hypothetical protein [Croceifilum oryzae]
MMILLAQIHFVQKAIAIGSTYIYVSTKYFNRGFQFQSAQYDTHFGDYFVMYQNEKGEGMGLQTDPSFFPVFVLYDSFDPE